MAGQSTAKAEAADGGARAAFDTTDQGVALQTAAPTTKSVNAILANNPTIKAAFGTSPDYFAADELGGAHTASGTALSSPPTRCACWSI